MRTTDRIAVLVGILLIFAMTVYPPWVGTGRFGSRIFGPIHAGYGFLTSPPGQSAIIRHYGYGTTASRADWSFEVDFPRLLLQWVLAVAATAALYWIARTAPAARTINLRRMSAFIVSKRQGFNRLFIAFWLAWLGYWLLYVYGDGRTPSWFPMTLSGPMTFSGHFQSGSSWPSKRRCARAIPQRSNFSRDSSPLR